MRNPFSRSAASLLLAASLAAFVWSSDAARGQVRISQIYGGGGNSGSVYKCDFIELFNAGPHAVDLGGWSVQYASSSGALWQRTRLTGSIPPWSWFLVQEAAGSGGTAELPTPDIRGSIAMSSTAGKVALTSDTTVLGGACPGGVTIVDFVGFGPATGCHEGSGPAPAPGNTAAVFRKGRGLVETGDNAADFETAPPAPRNSAAPPLAVPPAWDMAEPPGRPAAGTLLMQNYPNPFNPSTRFEFTVGRPAKTTLLLYNMLGEQVAVLFDGMARPGRRYAVRFQSGSLPAGVYLARLCAGADRASIVTTLLK